MSGAESRVEQGTDREIVISRVLNAPRERVWEAMTDPEQITQWWGPAGFTDTTQEWDFRVGGVWRHTMRGPDGREYPNRSVFTEIVQPERVGYSHGWDAKGAGEMFKATWTLEAQGDKTKVTIRMVAPSAAERDKIEKDFGAVEGGKQTLGRLAEFLSKAG
jgi:uncharacterized protein YndB with AHSA1/START domain